MGNCDEFRQNVRSGGIKTALTEIHLAGVFRSLQSINLYFRHMAHKKSREDRRKIFTTDNVYRTKL